MTKSNELPELTSRLDKIIGLLALQITQGKTITQGILALSIAGFLPREIAELVGTSPNTVRVILSNWRRARKARPRPKVSTTT